MKLQLLQPTPCFDPAQDLQGNSGSFLWVDGGNVRLIVAKEGHSIKSIRSVAVVPEAFTASATAYQNRSSTLVKISNADLSEEFGEDYRETNRTRS